MEWRELFEAVKRLSVETVRTVLSRGIDINTKDYQGNTALHLAVTASRKGHEDLVRFLLVSGSEVSAVNDVGDTPLATCLRYYDEGYATNLKIMKMLIEHGAGVDEREHDSNSTALHFAAKVDDVAFITYLLDKGADVNAADIENRTALHYLCAGELCCDPVALNALLSRGANVNAAMQGGSTALFLVVINDSILEHRAWQPIFNLFKKCGANFAVRDSFGRTPLDVALAENFLPGLIIDYIHVGQVDIVNTRLHHLGWTSLHAACSRMSLPLARYLLGRGAKIDAVDDTGATPLLVALNSVNEIHGVQLLKLLLEQRPNVNAVTNNNEHALSSVGRLPTAVKNLLMEHIARLSVAGEKVDESLYKAIEVNNHLRDYFKRCSSELERAAVHQILQTHSITLFDILVAEEASLMKCMRNPLYAEEFYRICGLHWLYPIYGVKIEEKFQRAVDADGLYHRSALALSCVFSGGVVDHQHLVFHKILTYLDLEDVQKIVESFYPD